MPPLEALSAPGQSLLPCLFFDLRVILTFLWHNVFEALLRPRGVVDLSESGPITWVYDSHNSDTVIWLLHLTLDYVFRRSDSFVPSGHFSVSFLDLDFDCLTKN